MRRKVYSDSIAYGLGVMEMKPKNRKAIAELEQLVAILYEGDIE